MCAQCFITDQSLISRTVKTVFYFLREEAFLNEFPPSLFLMLKCNSI